MVKHLEEVLTEYWNTALSMPKVFTEIIGRGGGASREAESQSGHSDASDIG